ncbi:MAG: PilZ domain-containing protein, partial [Terracidiphilus sp.]
GEQPVPPPVLPEPKKIEAKPARPEAPKLLRPAMVEKAPEPPAQIRTEEKEPPAKAEPPAPQPGKGRDRRGQSRHEVDTTATIFLVNVGSALRGRIIDLSLGGCRIRTDEKFPVGIYTRVEIEFHLQGLPFRLGGVIQAIHNRNTVGIRLLDLSERKRQQVLDLIDEIEEIRAETAQEEEPPVQQQGRAEIH